MNLFKITKKVNGAYMTNPTINVQNFENAVGNNASLMAMIPIFNESPTLVNLINSFDANSTLVTGNQITIGSTNQDPVNQSTGDSTATIESSLFTGFDPSTFNISTNTGIEQAELVAVELGHELAHTVDPNAQYTSDPTSLAEGVSYDENAEAIASVSSFNVANELNSFNTTQYGEGFDTQNANDNSAMQSALSATTVGNYQSLQDAQIATAENVISQPTYMPSGMQISYSQYLNDGVAVQLCNESSSTINSVNLNSGTINWNGVTSSNFSLTMDANGDGGWTLNASGITDVSGNTYSINANSGPTQGSGLTQTNQCVINQTAPSGQQSGYIFGQGVSDGLSNASLLVAPDTSAELTGTGDSSTVSSGSSATVTNTNNTINMDDGSTLLDTAGTGNDTINAGAGDTIQISNDGSSYTDTINASGDAGITLDSGSALDVAGSGNTITTSNSDTLTAGGDTIDAASGDTLSLSDAGGVQNTIDGSGFTISENNGSVAFDGSGTLSGTGNTLEVDADSVATVANTNDTIDMSSGSSLIDNSIHGGDTINAASGDTIQISNGGYSDTINASDDASITLDGGAAANIVGSGNGITAAGDNTITASGDAIT
ncbi:beta strand repeat-containing protein, partial [Dyella monticola]